VKILFVTNSLGVGGIETNLVLLTRGLTARGHSVDVAAAGGSLTDQVRSAGGGVVPLQMTPRRPAALREDVRTLARHVRRSRPDVVHVFSAASNVAVQLSRPLWGRAARVPVVASVMGLHAAPDERDLAVRLRVALTAAGARRLVVMAPAIDAVVRRSGVRRAKTVHQSVVGVDLPPQDVPGDRERVRRELGIPADDHVVLTIGRLEPRKSHELFISAAAHLHGRTGRPAHFLIAGDGAEEQRLLMEVERAGLQGVVRLLGHRSDVYPLLRASDVCVRPGVVEGFIGITVLEAQALGVPVVSFDTQDVRLAIEDERTGLLVPRGDTRALAEAVGRLLTEPELAGRLGPAGREQVQGTYGLPSVLSGLERLYADVAGRRAEA
jgi:glycosyltransferase involved in cell wall biosynthesis